MVMTPSRTPRSSCPRCDACAPDFHVSDRSFCIFATHPSSSFDHISHLTSIQLLLTCLRPPTLHPGDLPALRSFDRHGSVRLVTTPSSIRIIVFTYIRCRSTGSFGTWSYDTFFPKISCETCLSRSQPRPLFDFVGLQNPSLQAGRTY